MLKSSTIRSSCLIFILLLFFFTEGITQRVENGVSRELATWRSKNILHPRYRLSFHIPAGNQSIEATENIYFDLKDTSRLVQLDFTAPAQQVHRLIVNGKQIKPVCKNEHLLIRSDLLRASNNELLIEFTSNGKPMKMDSGRLVYCLFVPARARESFPCFDQPDLKAVFELSLTVPNGWLAVSNGSLADSLSVKDETTWNFAPTFPISTYLFSFAAGKFNRYSETRSGRTISFYYAETQQRKIDSSLKRCVDLNFKAIDFVSAYLGIPYPFPKFDFVEIPGFSVSGMEHPGAVFYRGDAMFFDEASATQLYNRSVTIGHEVSHMWFGDLVTMKWFNEVWLKEVFANYMGNQFASSERPDSAFAKKFLLSNFPAAYSIDRFSVTDPIMRQLPNLNLAGLAYGPITYNKAPIMMHQMELLLGAESFQKGVQDYIRKYSGGNADFFELVEQFKKHTPENLDAWMKTWVNKPGRPLFVYKLDTAAGSISKLNIIQRGEYEPALFWPQQFELMLFYSNEEPVTIKVPMRKASQQVAEAAGKKVPDFILFNSSGEGYGVFPADTHLTDAQLKRVPVTARASFVIALFEQMLRCKQKDNMAVIGSNIKLRPGALLNRMCSLVQWEPDRQLLERELRYIEMIYWKLLLPGTRKKISAELEQSLMDAIRLQPASNKTAVFRTFMKLAQTDAATDTLYQYWDKRTLPQGVSFGTGDWIQLSKQLAVRDHHTKEILQRQLDSLKDYNDRKSFSFQMKALSASVQERDSFFNSLLRYDGRKQEADVTEALQWLHHPLRQHSSLKYIHRSLSILPELLHTNDIFFTPDWIAATVENYQDASVAQLLKRSIAGLSHQLPELLLQKLKQSAAWVYRAEEVAE